MKFFEKTRPEVFLHSAKYRRDKKTGKRIWGFTLIVTFSEKLGTALAQSCAVSVVKAWQYITDRDAAAVDVLLASEVTGCAIDFFAQIDDAEPALQLSGVDLGGLRMTRAKTVVEFWFSGAHENTDGLHAFMKKFAYTRCWAQFSPQQADLPLKPAKKGK
jgi:hypothetical protein